MTTHQSHSADDNREIQSVQIEWQGITLSITYEEHWLGSERESPFDTAHLQVRVSTPIDAIIPITETGYRSHFIHRDAVRELGGPGGYVLAWLDEAARSHEWTARVAARNQLKLL